MIENKRYSMRYQMCKVAQANFLTVLERVVTFGVDKSPHGPFVFRVATHSPEKSGRALQGV
jgi:hypothetical protein